MSDSRMPLPSDSLRTPTCATGGGDKYLLLSLLAHALDELLHALPFLLLPHLPLPLASLLVILLAPQFLLLLAPLLLLQHQPLLERAPPLLQALGLGSLLFGQAQPLGLGLGPQPLLFGPAQALGLGLGFDSQALLFGQAQSLGLGLGPQPLLFGPTQPLGLGFSLSFDSPPLLFGPAQPLGFGFGFYSQPLLFDLAQPLGLLLHALALLFSHSPLLLFCLSKARRLLLLPEARLVRVRVRPLLFRRLCLLSSLTILLFGLSPPSLLLLHFQRSLAPRLLLLLAHPLLLFLLLPAPFFLFQRSLAPRLLLLLARPLLFLLLLPAPLLLFSTLALLLLLFFFPPPALHLYALTLLLLLLLPLSLRLCFLFLASSLILLPPQSRLLLLLPPLALGLVAQGLGRRLRLKRELVGDEGAGEGVLLGGSVGGDEEAAHAEELLANLLELVVLGPQLGLLLGQPLLLAAELLRGGLLLAPRLLLDQLQHVVERVVGHVLLPGLHHLGHRDPAHPRLDPSLVVRRRRWRVDVVVLLWSSSCRR
ncbi:uncharacterized protein ACA1_108750 [Acanthamoeba castellanii str. Neff]|uniref:Uncharacterized protein n=1 Tax=Acanthamoeba castellanii (strain ATCC 30010 / Neff) TaxID=1257118 RepID=L8GF43_ACACF|nr:uncharacterized protein ACA1_108750 [Acanthamoeba castellanii str. Neff]ELR10806.1 hypothetical protein ACA1_108750 [Acanthamoeba castellanii str. Neff]